MPPEHLLNGLPEHTSLTLTTLDNGLSLWLLEVDSNLTMDASGIQRWWSAMPYWAFAWAGGRVLADWILAHPEAVADKVVLDFGCGSGIVALAAAKAGAKASWAVDIDPLALKAVQANAELNGLEILTSDDWSAVPADCFFSSDVLYDPGSHQMLRQLCRAIPQGWLAEPGAALNAMVNPDDIRAEASVHGVLSATLPVIGDFDQAVNIEILPVFHS